MTKLENERSLTTEDLVRDGVSGVLKIFQKEATHLLAMEGTFETQKGYLLALCSAFFKQMEAANELKMQFLDLMAERDVTVPKTRNSGEPANEYLYYLRTLFGEKKGAKWVPNRTYENWARPLRYLVSLDVHEVSEFCKKIDSAEAVKGSKTLRRIEALRALDEKANPGKGRKPKISSNVEIPLSLLRVTPVASFAVAADAIPLNEDKLGLAVVYYQDGKLNLLFGSTDGDEINRIAAASYLAQRERLPTSATGSSHKSALAAENNADEEIKAA